MHVRSLCKYYIIIEELPRAPKKRERDYIKLSLNLTQGSLHILRCNDHHQRCGGKQIIIIYALSIQISYLNHHVVSNNKNNK